MPQVVVAVLLLLVVKVHQVLYLHIQQERRLQGWQAEELGNAVG
jgi:hypothetical protein